MHGQEVGIPCLNAEADHPASGLLHLLQQGIIDMLGPYGTVECHGKGFCNEAVHERLHPFPVKGELVVVKIDVTDVKPCFQVFQVAVKVICRVITKASLENAPVAIGAGIGATPA
jgi:hypothetical protein